MENFSPVSGCRTCLTVSFHHTSLSKALGDKSPVCSILASFNIMLILMCLIKLGTTVCRNNATNGFDGRPNNCRQEKCDYEFDLEP